MDKTATNFMEMDALSKALSETDPRIQGRTQYSAVLIMLVALMGVYARCDTWTLIADYAKCHIPLIRKFLPDVKDTPSHDTIRRFFCIVDTCKLEAFYRDWACGMFRALNEASDAPRERTFRHVAIDGKTICGAVPARDPLRDDESAGYKLHMVSAYLSEEGLSLGQERVSAKHNELEAIPKLIDSLDIGEGDVVTIDAMGTHADIAEAIYRKNAEYLLEVKDNQKLLKEAIIRTFASWGDRTNPRRISRAETCDDDRGYITSRKCWSCGETLALGLLRDKWPGIRSYGRIHVERTCKKTGRTCEESHYFISSLPNDAALILKHKRLHWGVENGLHWRLDVTFDEDDGRKRMNSAQNYSVINKMALAVLNSKPSKNSMNRRRMMLGWDDKAMEQIIHDTIAYLTI